METQTTQPQVTPFSSANGTNGHQNTPRRYVRPRASIAENTDGFTVQVEMPGVPANGLEVTFENGELTLVGHRATGDHHEVVHRESQPADYRRVFEVDSTIDAARISARIDQGLLTLSLPKAEASKPRRIEIGGVN